MEHKRAAQLAQQRARDAAENKRLEAEKARANVVINGKPTRQNQQHRKMQPSLMLFKLHG